MHQYELRQPLDSDIGTTAFSLHQLIFVVTIPMILLLTLFQFCYTKNAAMATVKYYRLLVEIRQMKAYRLYVNVLKLVVAAIFGYGLEQCRQDDNGDGILAIGTASVVMLTNFPQIIPVKYDGISQAHLNKYLRNQKKKGDGTKEDIKQTITQTILGKFKEIFVTSTKAALDRAVNGALDLEVAEDLCCCNALTACLDEF